MGIHTHIWIPIVVFTLLILSIAIKYSFDRRHYKTTSRRQVNNVENSNNTVVYTIPTTGQLSSTYPDLTQSRQNRPPSYVSSGEAPPSYDQAISTPASQPVNLVLK